MVYQFSIAACISLQPLLTSFSCGASTFELCGAEPGLDLVRHPDMVAQPDIGCLAFAWFWSKGNPTGRSLSLLADAGDIARVSRAVNGGSKGLSERIALTTHALRVLA